MKLKIQISIYKQTLPSQSGAVLCWGSGCVCFDVAPAPCSTLVRYLKQTGRICLGPLRISTLTLADALPTLPTLQLHCCAALENVLTSQEVHTHTQTSTPLIPMDLGSDGIMCVCVCVCRTAWCLCTARL